MGAHGLVRKGSLFEQVGQGGVSRNRDPLPQVSKLKIILIHRDHLARFHQFNLREQVQSPIGEEFGCFRTQGDVGRHTLRLA